MLANPPLKAYFVFYMYFYKSRMFFYELRRRKTFSVHIKELKLLCLCLIPLNINPIHKKRRIQ